MESNEIHCDDCETGFSSFKISRELKSVTGILASKKLVENGQRCVMCLYCKVGKRKAKLIKKMNASFQSLDLFVHVKCPQCKSENFSRIDAHYFCKDCGLKD